MNFYRTQLISSITTLLLVLCILAPTALKLSHAIYEHESLQCAEPGAVHVHEIELDCDFQKFKLSTQYYSVPVNFENQAVTVELIKNSDFYTFLNNYQKLPFALRGPPIS